MGSMSARQRRTPDPLDQLAILYALVDQIQRARRVEYIYDEAVEGIQGALAVDRSAIVIRSGSNGPLVRACERLSAASRDALLSYQPWKAADRNPRPVVVENLSHDPAGFAPGAALAEDGVQGAAWVPLLHRGRLIGELFLGRVDPRPFEEAELRLADAIAGHIAFAIWRVHADEDQAELLRRFEAERSVLDSVIKQMPAGVLLADVPSGRIITSNPQVTAIWRKTLRHAGRVSDYAMWEGFDEEGTPLPPEAWPLARSVLHGEAVRSEEIRIRRGDGCEGIIRMSSAPVVDSRGRQLAAVATVFDVTAEREEEERQAFLEEVSEVLNASIELDATVSGLARAVVKTFAEWCVVYRAREGDVIERVTAAHRTVDLSQVAPSLTRGRIPSDPASPIRRVNREQDPLFLPEIGAEEVASFLREDAEVLDAVSRLGVTSAILLPLSARGQPLGVVAMLRSSARFDPADLALATEVSRRASTAMENALLYEQARAADLAKSRFLAVMSHEFRTPLSAILGYADIMTARVHGDLTVKQGEHLERIKASVRHLSHLVDEILTFASMEAGKERVIRSRVDLPAIAADVVAIMEPMADVASLSLKLTVRDSPIVASSDASKLRQILINLVSNAVKYTAEGGVEVELWSEGGRAFCTVSDTGPGIAKENLEQVFEPFWQVDRPRGAHVTGSGLGLAVARRLARLMGGEVMLESEIGVGSTFTLVLPLEPPAVATPPTG